MSRGRTVLFAAFLVVLVSHPIFGEDFKSLPMPEQVSKLIKSGGMGGPLDPTGSNYTAEGNASMYSAMSAWNGHDWDTAVERLKEHLQKFPDDPWAAEATLHLGCHAFYTKDYTSAENYFKSVISRHDGQAVGIKALTRIGPTYFLQGRANEAAEAFAKVLKQSKSWDDRTYAHSWLLKIDQAKSEWLETGLYSECGRDSLKVVFEILGDKDKAAEIARFRLSSFEGLTMEEVRALSEKHGRPCWGARVSAENLPLLPVPFIARYGSNHFVVVKSISDGKVAYYDPFGGDKTAELASFEEAYYGDVLLFSRPEGMNVTLLGAEEMSAIRGGCCGSPMPASGPCPAGEGEDDCECEEPAPNPGPCAGPDSTPAPGPAPGPSPKPCPSSGPSAGPDPLSGPSAGGVAPGGDACPGCGGSSSGGLPGLSAPRLFGSAPLQKSLTFPRRSPGVPQKGYVPKDVTPKLCWWCGRHSNFVRFNRRNATVLVDCLPLFYDSGVGPDVRFLLTYNSKISDSRSFGRKWRFVYDSYYVVLPGTSDVEIITVDGRDLTFTCSGGNYTPPDGCIDSLVKNQDNSYTFTDRYTGVAYTYGASSQKIESIEDPWGNEIALSRDQSGYLTKVTDANSRSTVLESDGSGRVTKITDPLSNEAAFYYDTSTADLTKVVDAGSSSTTFAYDADGYLTTRTTPAGTQTFA